MVHREREEIKNNLFIRWAIFFVGLIVMSFGIVLMIEADLGVAPWDVLHIGLTNKIGLTVGTWTIIAGFCMITLTTVLTKELPKLGAFLNMMFVGVFIDLFRLFINTPNSIVGQYIMLLSGLIVIGYGVGLYIAPKCGAGPRDSLMIAVTEISGYKIQYVRSIMELLVLLIGWFLGGPVFIGTIIFCLAFGYIVGFTLPQCQQIVNVIIERGIKNEDINKRKIRINNYDRVSKKVR